MFEKLLTPFTTATAGGTVFRDAFIAVGIILSMLGTIGWLDTEQVIALQKAVEDLSGQWPAILALFGVLSSIGMTIYRALFKSSSNRGAALAKKTDAEIPPNVSVKVEAPSTGQTITVPANPK